jgi:hypothetical protein
MFCVFLAAFLGACGGGSNKKDYQCVSLIQLISSPERYGETKVMVIGYLRLDFEGEALYLHEIDYDRYISPNSISLRLDSDKLTAEQRKLDGQYVQVGGLYRQNHLRRFQVRAGSLSQIVLLEKWPWEDIKRFSKPSQSPQETKGGGEPAPRPNTVPTPPPNS